MSLRKGFRLNRCPRAREHAGMRPINLVVIHCSASPDGRRNTVEDIDSWHAARGFHRAPEWRARQNPSLIAVGYHYVIYTDGTVVTGRHVDEIGAHAFGLNEQSIGICMVGTDHFAPGQWASLRHLLVAEVARITGIPGPSDRNSSISPATALAVADKARIAIHGHRELPDVHKECPGFDVSEWLAGGLAPLTAHLLEEKSA